MSTPGVDSEGGARALTHERLPVRALHRAADDVADVVLEALVEHPVRLVEDEIRHPAEVARALVGEVEDAPRGADDDARELAAVVHVLERLDLRALVHAAEHGDARDPERLAELVERLVRLDGELARWRHDEDGDGRAFRLLVHWLRDQAGEGR